MTEVVVKEIDNEEPKEETTPEPIQEEARQSLATYREAPKEEEKPEEVIEQPRSRETTTNTKTQEGKTVKGETAF